MSIQTTLTGALVGACVAVMKHPCDRQYLRRVYACLIMIILANTMKSVKLITLISRLNIPEVSTYSIWKRMYKGFLPSLTHASLFNAIFFGTFAFFWGINNQDFITNLGLHPSMPHVRGHKLEDTQPVHYEKMGKCIIVATCAYTAAQLVSYPFGVYKNMKYGFNWI